MLVYSFFAAGYYFLLYFGFYLNIPFFVLYLNHRVPCLLLSSLYFSGIRGYCISPSALKSSKLAFTVYIASSFVIYSSITYNVIYFYSENLKNIFFVYFTSSPYIVSVLLEDPPNFPTTYISVFPIMSPETAIFTFISLMVNYLLTTFLLLELTIMSPKWLFLRFMSLTVLFPSTRLSSSICPSP